MKKLLGVIGILALATALLPAQGYADLRGSFAPITIASGFVNGCEQPATRPGPNLTSVDARLVEAWVSFSTRSLVPGRESVRSIWMHLNQQQAPLAFGNGTFVPLFFDPAAGTSWFDPAWSHDGRYLAYVQTGPNGEDQKLYIQEYKLSPAPDDIIAGDPRDPSDVSTGGVVSAGFEANVGISGYRCDGFEFFTASIFDTVVTQQGQQEPETTYVAVEPFDYHCTTSSEDLTEVPLTYYPGLETPIGAPILIASTGKPRHPAFHPTRHELAFDWDDAGSIDLYTIDLDANDDGTLGDLGMPVRRTFLEVKGEETPSWAPNGHDIVYSTNRFGPSVLEIIDLNLSSADPAYTRLVEPNFTFVSHRNPDYDGDGGEIWYDAPAGEDASLPASVWKINLATQAKCEIQFDERTDADPDVSNRLQDAQAGAGVIPFYYALMSSQASNFGLNVWRVNAVNSCVTALPMGVTMDPTNINLKSSGQTIKTSMRFPPETKALGYVCRSGNVGGEGVRLRASIYNSPTLAGLPCVQNLAVSPGGALDASSSNTNCVDAIDPTGERIIDCWWSRKDIAERLVALGLTDQVIPLEMTAYSNRTGRPFKGIVYTTVAGSKNAAPVTLLRNSPNPFNPVTKIQFAVGQAGKYSVKIFNVRGELVRTLSNQHYDVGVQEATWDGRTTGGGKAASGIYLAKIFGAGSGESGSLRLVLAK